ncbi:YARHG domain-containing protein [Prosthecodimorpha staleyi]|uniref:YARHG domain-containing protein n=1 Tax=Prosthecodimorpha staleyi TaxID=2840188 RepID=A0A947GBF1_9HYPH|nr:YARHG domain-containing protein [Prosthecodimorpha staleyi]MBT9288006.1 YARHG domain-containing protein [Prosthecodimorpha staleyi]
MIVSRQLAAAGSLASLVLWAAPAAAKDFWSMSCPQLWYERNSIYHERGYCFQTERGIRTFGNAGCVTSNESALGLSSTERRTIALIVQVERQKYCK